MTKSYLSSLTILLLAVSPAWAEENREASGADATPASGSNKVVEGKSTVTTGSTQTGTVIENKTKAADPDNQATAASKTEQAEATKDPTTDITNTNAKAANNVNPENKNVSLSRPRITLALGGGGCKCITHIGVIKVLEKNHIPIDYIVGTSSGATIGALYCAGVPINEIEKMYHDGTIQSAMVPNMVPKLLLKPLEKLTSPLAEAKPAGVTDGAKFRDFLAKRLPSKFSGMKIPFAAVATNLTDGQTYMLNEGDVSQAVLASNAFPGLFRPVNINGKLYVDGGVKANMPANCAKATGADLIISVMSNETISKQPNEKYTTMKAVLGRVSDIMLADADKNKIKDSDIVIIPRIQEIPYMTKNTAQIEAAEKSGEEAANAAVPKIKALIDNKNKAAVLP